MITFRIFISSTFADFEQERAVLQDVFDRLRPWCAAREARLEVVDLRWGVNENEQLVHGTLDLCLDEIRRCHNVKPRPNFIILAGARYGWCPLPNRVDGAIWDKLAREGEAERELLFNWYEPDPSLLDVNLQRPTLATRVLQPIDENLLGRSAVGWAAAQEKLRAVFGRVAAGLDKDQAVRLTGSATHQEVMLGALQAGCEPPLLFLRSMAEPIQHPTSFADPPDDCAVQRNDLLTTLASRFGGQRDTLAISVPQAELGWPKADYLRVFGEWAYSRLLHHVDEQAKQAHAATTPAGLEAEAHAAYGAARLTGQAGRRSFIGRSVELAAIDERLRLGSRPLLLTAPGGSGKTALIAEAARIARATDLHIVERYAGATPASLSVDLIGAIQLAAAGGCDGILIDAMDLLPPEMPRRIAALAAELAVPLCATMRLETGQSLPNWANGWDTQSLVPVREGAPPAEVLDATMAAATLPRRLVGEHRAHVLGLLGPDAPPLAVRIAASLAGRPGAELPKAGAGLAEWVEAALDDAETASTPVLARSAVEAIALSRFGLSREELAELLWEDVEVRAEFEATRHWDWNDSGLPPILLSRVLDRLQPVLIEAESDGATTFRFLHREFHEAAVRRTMAPELRLAALGRFFGRELPRDMDATVTPSVRRALLEGPRALIGSKNVAAMMVELADLRFIGVKVGAGLLADLFEDLQMMAVHVPLAARLRAWLGALSHQLKTASRREGRDILVQAACDMPPDHPAYLLVRRWLREDGADHRWLRGPTVAGRPMFTEPGLAFDAVGVVGGRLVSWSEPEVLVQQLDLWDMETTLRLCTFRHGGARNGQAIGIEAAGEGLFWTWFAAAEPEPRLEYPVAQARPGVRRFPFGLRPPSRVPVDAPDPVVCGVRLWREHPTDPAVDTLTLLTLCWCRALGDGRLLTCDWSGRLRVLRAGTKIEVDWEGETPEEAGAHAWAAAGLDFDLIRTAGAGALLTVHGRGGTVTATVPEPGTWQLEVLLATNDMILLHPGAVCTGLHPAIWQLVFKAPVAARAGRFGTALVRFGSGAGNSADALTVEGRPLGALEAGGGVLVWTEDRSHPADPDPSYAFRVYRIEGRHDAPVLLHHFDDELRGLVPIAGLGLWVVDSSGGVMLLPLDGGEPIGCPGSKAWGIAALPGDSVATWTSWGPDDNEPTYGDRRLSIWASDGRLVGSHRAGGVVLGVAATDCVVVALLEGGGAARIDRTSVGDEGLAISHAERCGENMLLAAELGGGLAMIGTATGSRRAIPGTAPGDDVIAMYRLSGGWVAVQRGDVPNEHNLRTEVYDEAGVCRSTVHMACWVTQLTSRRLLIEGEVEAPVGWANTLLIPTNAEMLACGVVQIVDENGYKAAFDSYAGLPIEGSGLGSLSDLVQVDWVPGVGSGFAVEKTKRGITLSLGDGLPAVAWAAPGSVVYAEPQTGGALVLLDSGEPRQLMLCRGNFPDRKAMQAAARAQAPAAPAPEILSDAELFARAELLHDRTLNKLKTDWTNGRGNPALVCEALLNRWRLSFYRASDQEALAARLAESLPVEWGGCVSLEQAFGLLELGGMLAARNVAGARAIAEEAIGVCARQDLLRVGLTTTLAAVARLMSLTGRSAGATAGLSASVEAARMSSTPSMRRRRGMLPHDFVERSDAEIEQMRRSSAEKAEADWLRERRGPVG